MRGKDTSQDICEKHDWHLCKRPFAFGLPLSRVEKGTAFMPKTYQAMDIG